MTNTARIVFDINERESVEIPFEYNETHDNNHTKRKAQKAKGSKSKFYYLDIKEYERRVRADERVRLKKQKEQRRKDFIKLSKAFIKYAWQKSVGFGIVFSSAYIAYSNYSINEKIGFMNWLLMALTIPVGLYMFFSNYFFFKKREKNT